MQRIEFSSDRHPHRNTAENTSDETGAEAGGFLLAIDFGGTKIAMATATLSGERLHEHEIPTHAEQGAESVIARMFDASSTLVSKTVEHTGAPLVAVSAVTPRI